MLRLLLGVSFILATATQVHADDSFCLSLKPEELDGSLAVAPPSCAEAPPGLCAAMTSQIIACLKRGHAKIVTAEGVKAALGEHLVAELGRGTDSAQWKELTDALGVSKVVFSEIHVQGGSAVGLVRIVSTSENQILAAARLRLSDDPSHSGNIAQSTVDEGLTVLAEKLAKGYLALGSARRRVAVLNFTENGELSKKNGLGTLISAELVTRFRRDYGLSLVERSKLDAVLKELELGQTGFIDDKMAPKLGKMLEADALVIGSASDAGTTVKVNAQMVDVVTGATLVADSVDLKAAGLVTLSSDAVVMRSKSGAAFRSLLIPGWGQLYNRQPGKGYVFMGLAIGTGGTAVVADLLGNLAQNNYNKARYGANFNSLAQTVDDYAIARDIALGALGLVWLINVIDAAVNGVTFDSAVNSSVGSASTSLHLTRFGFGGSF